MPKRPPRTRQEIEIPEDLLGDIPLQVTQTPLGALWKNDALDFLKAIETESVDLVVTDPPYAIGKAAWDVFPSLDAYVEWCGQWLEEVFRVLSPTGTAYICGFSEILAELKVLSRRWFPAQRWLVWYYKNKANLGKDWGRSHESVLHLRKAKTTRIAIDRVRIPYNGHTKKYPVRVQSVSSQYGGGKRRDRWTPHPLGAKPRDVLEIPVLCNGTDEKTAHPTQKPYELIKRFVLASSEPGDLVVDPFCGSGTTPVVCEDHERKWLACDLSAEFVYLTQTRLQETAKQKSE